MAIPGIFVSHSHADDAWCRGFVKVLSEAGYDVWYDQESLHVGDSWMYATDSISITAFRGNDGREIWNTASSYYYPANDNNTAFSVTDGIICCGGGYDASGQFISAFSAKDGHQLWKSTIHNIFTLFIAEKGGVVYIPVRRADESTQGLRALQLSTGKLLWFYAKPGIIDGSVSATLNGVAYFASRDDTNTTDAIDAIRIKDGSTVWHLPMKGLAKPVMAQGVLYTGIANGAVDPSIYAIRASDGKILWHYHGEANTFGIQVGM